MEAINGLNLSSGSSVLSAQGGSFGNNPFLIKQVLETEPSVRFPALSLGLLRAHP